MRNLIAQALADAGEAGDDVLCREIVSLRKEMGVRRALVDEVFGEVAHFYTDRPGLLGEMAKQTLRRVEGAAEKERILTSRGGDLAGLQLSNKASDRFAFFLADATEPGRYRMSYFDAQGFFGHATRDTYAELLDMAFMDGYRREVTGVLECLSSTDTFVRGNQFVAIVQAVNSGQLSWNDGLRRLYDQAAPETAEQEIAEQPR